MELVASKERIVEFIRTKCEEAGCGGVVVGLSGGIDSSLVAYLSAEALGPENVLGIHMPELNVTPAEDVLDATQVAGILGIEFKTIDISEIVESFLNNMPEGNPAESYANGNLKARIRMSILYYYANLARYLVGGTGNKTEILLGYYTKYGDGGVDIEPIGDLFKTEVRQMADILDIPADIINKPPSAALYVGQTDEEDLGLPYDTIDRILSLLLEGLDTNVVQSMVGVSAEEMHSLLVRIDSNLHKRKVPPIADLSDLRF
ncbi:NAD+ synthase [Methanohalophilus levihalophilus]|uniref:NAD+ synthase n=1 Tax=Methanohalophilus levihalophilus TaxID=1431282 RepID=UPI001AEB6238|nr:NAD+ synthase [Methanohalophilus levihalophilus]MBP2030566.1 NAD+ synthase [Methanohalophilus levihalophilus]